MLDFLSHMVTPAFQPFAPPGQEADACPACSEGPGRRPTPAEAPVTTTISGVPPVLMNPPLKRHSLTASLVAYG
jgi:hypothetical protein